MTESIWHEERLLIDGALRSAEHDATYPVENPATGGQLGVAADATPADVEAALAAARRAFDESGWAGDVETSGCGAFASSIRRSSSTPTSSPS